MLTPLIITLLFALALIQVAVFSTTIFLHRTATHRALVLHPVVEVMFRFALWVTTGITTREWVAVHRKHHAFTDEEGDPHSPRLVGFWSVQLGNVFHYIREARQPSVVEKYAHDIKDGVSVTDVRRVILRLKPRRNGKRKGEGEREGGDEGESEGGGSGSGSGLGLERDTPLPASDR